jgi:dihydroorotate dehydrogenase electron transfer subunit
VSKQRSLSLPLSRRQPLGNDYHVLHFTSDRPLEARPGQFAMVRSADWGLTPLLPRPMSLLTAGAEPSLLVKVVGEGTRKMARAAVGEVFNLLAPLGSAWPTPPADRLPLLVAGGCGVAPLLYLARELAGNVEQSRQDIVALYGGRTKQDLPLADQFNDIAELHLCTEDGSRGTKGRVTVALQTALERFGNRAAVYCCGPWAMMAAVAKMAQDHGAVCWVSLESLMGCGYGVCLGCPTGRSDGGYLYTCKDGPCVDAREVDWNEVTI